jgi:peptide/nickel transport system ATP-binding protein/oligopeptide transport system ATP-binding protein
MTATGPAAAAAVLQLEQLRTYFAIRDGMVKAVDGIDLQVRPGRTLGVVGESGCGKTVTALSIMRLLPRTGRIVSGRIMFGGRDLAQAGEDEMRELRGNAVSMIFQEPMTSLNPVFTVGDQVGEVIRQHLDLSERQVRDRVLEMFQLVGIADVAKRVSDYPHQMSGGMRQRVMIAMALACNPAVLIADEPTTALDVTIQAQILELMRELQRRNRMAIILITHDLGVVAEMADEVAVMYAGKVIEHGTADQIFDSPRHPYTQGLLASIPSLAARGRPLTAITGTVPHPLNLPPGCTFAPRCPRAFERCVTAFPARMDQGDAHDVACYLYGDRAEPAATPDAGRLRPAR